MDRNILTGRFTLKLEFLGLMDGDDYGQGAVPEILKDFPPEGVEVKVRTVWKGDKEEITVVGVIEKILEINPADAKVILKTEKHERIKSGVEVYVGDKKHNIEAKGTLS